MAPRPPLSGGRILVVGLGAVLVALGFAARSLAENTSSLPYRVLTSPDGVVGAYWVVGFDAPTEIEQLDDGTFGVVRTEDGRRTVLFSGSEEAAAFWFETGGTTPEFTGSPAAVEAWVGEQQAAEDDPFWPTTLMIAGAVLVIGGLAVGWRRAPVSA